MTRVNIHIEDREGGRYFVQVESSFPNQRRGEAFPVGIDAALDKVREFCRDFGVDDAAALPMMRPALQADIDRAQEAQEAAGDVHPMHLHGAALWEPTPEWVIPIADGDAVIPLSSEPERRKPGRPRKDA